MHNPSVTQELVMSIRVEGDISKQEFGKLIRHWFPGAWTMFFGLKRQACPKPAKREEDDTVPNRIFHALRDKFGKVPARPAEPFLVPHLVRAPVSGMVGGEATNQVYEVMASDAMRRCAEETFGAQMYLENEETLVMVPEGIQSPMPAPSAFSVIEERYPLTCGQIRAVLADMQDSGDGFGRRDCTQSPHARAELVKLMSIRSYRRCMECEFDVELGYQWPGIIAAARRNAADRLALFQSSSEQIFAIDNISS